MIWASIAPYIIGLIALIGGALGIYAKGRGDEKTKTQTKATKTYIKDRKAADHADQGIGATDLQRIERLRQFADSYK